MGYGNEPVKSAHSGRHRYMRKELLSDGKLHPVRVGCRSPLPTDYCSKCKKQRSTLEVVPA